MTDLDVQLEERSRRIARGLDSVDAAVTHHRAILAAEAIGHFLRRGRPGPPYFSPPAARAKAA